MRAWICLQLVTEKDSISQMAAGPAIAEDTGVAPHWLTYWEHPLKRQNTIEMYSSTGVEFRRVHFSCQLNRYALNCYESISPKPVGGGTREGAGI